MLNPRDHHAIGTGDQRKVFVIAVARMGAVFVIVCARASVVFVRV